MQYWYNKALDHIRVVYKNGVLNCDGKFVFESSVDYVSTLGQIISKKENTVNSHYDGDKRIEGVPLFVSSSTKEIGQYPEQLEGAYQLHFKTFLMYFIPNEDKSVFSPFL
ncbi:hypothetical protein ENUP19_0337G0015 [Entamoeba nuttalli]|uniref:Uncharacterized protein n=1 Tax=Entamoeba nuttalli TaxID=412467 RepID=A0ABQ0DWY9_9EUKA